MLLAAVAYGLLAGPSWASEGRRVSIAWLLSCYVALSIAEIFVGPLGYALVSQYAPVHSVGRLIGALLLATAAGSFLAGETGARFWTSCSHSSFFSAIAAISLLVMAIVLPLQGRLSRALGQP
jgi:POT family proton-dependent oligopeptide transporter